MLSNIDKHYTFNYTPTFERIFKKNRITSFLHGKINSNLNQIVLGISEIPSEELDKKYFLPFTKYFQKLDNETDYLFLREYEREKNNNFIFFFWGHSLDVSDRDYINEVFDFINNLQSEHKKIVVIFHTKDSKSKLLINLLNIRGKNDIEKLMKKNELIFCHKDSRELKDELERDISPRPISINIF